MADTPMETAAQAFDSVVKSEPGRSRAKAPEADGGPPVELFRNIGALDKDTEAKGGGDEDDPEDLIYGKDQDSTRTRDPRKGKGEDSEGDDDESDGDDAIGEEDDPDGDGDESDADESESSQEEAALLRRKVEVTVDGEPVEVSLKEALEGYVRTETFHRRMNQLDEAKKIIRRAAADAVHNYEYSVNIAREMEAHMEKMIPKEPDWDQEFARDPAKARELQRYYEQANGFRAALRQQVMTAAQKQSESSNAQLAAYAEEESAKFEQSNRKHWSDPKKRVKDLQSMRKTGLASGFSEDELSTVYDSRMLTVLLKASKYDRMMAAKPKPVIQQRQGKPVPPGAGSAKQRTAQRGVTSAMNRLNRTGKIEDAAVVFDQIIARSK